jgi:hypothetical protein
MSSESRRQPTGRISPRKETERVSKGSIEGNLEKLGFLAAPKPKKAHKGEKSHRAVGFRSSASDTSNAPVSLELGIFQKIICRSALAIIHIC